MVVFHILWPVKIGFINEKIFFQSFGVVLPDFQTKCLKINKNKSKNLKLQ